MHPCTCCAFQARADNHSLQVLLAGLIQFSTIKVQTTEEEDEEELTSAAANTNTSNAIFPSRLPSMRSFGASTIPALQTPFIGNIHPSFAHTSLAAIPSFGHSPSMARSPSAAFGAQDRTSSHGHFARTSLGNPHTPHLSAIVKAWGVPGRAGVGAKPGPGAGPELAAGPGPVAGPRALRRLASASAADGRSRPVEFLNEVEDKQRRGGSLGQIGEYGPPVKGGNEVQAQVCSGCVCDVRPCPKCGSICPRSTLTLTLSEPATDLMRLRPSGSGG